MAGVGGLRVRTEGSSVELVRAAVARRIVGAALAAFAIVLWQVSSPELRAQAGWILAPGLLGLVGVLLATTRDGISIDTNGRTITKWWRVGPLGRAVVKRLDTFAEVDVRKEIVRSGNNNRTTVHYPVRLMGDDQELRIVTSTEPAASRRLGEAIARVTWLPMRCDVAGEVVVRPPDELDWSLAQRLADAGSPPARPEPPTDTKLSVSEHGGTVSIDVPAPGALRSGLMLMLLAMPGGLLASTLVIVFGHAAPAGFLVLFLLILLGPPLALAAVALVRGNETVHVDVDPDHVRIERKRPGRRRVVEFDGPTVEEIVVTPPAGGPFGEMIASGGVTLIRDVAFHRIGRGLSADDLRHLADLVAWSLCQRVRARTGAAETRQIRPGVN